MQRRGSVDVQESQEDRGERLVRERGTGVDGLAQGGGVVGRGEGAMKYPLINTLNCTDPSLQPLPGLYVELECSTVNSFQPIVASLVVFDGLCQCGCSPLQPVEFYARASIGFPHQG